MTTATLDNAPIPISDPIARPRRPEYGKGPDPQEGLLTVPWIDWLSRLTSAVSATPTRRNSVAVSAQEASIAATDVTAGAVGGGAYRVSGYAIITRAATTSSSLTLTFAWTDSGIVTGMSSAAATGNTVGTLALIPSQLIHVDNVSPITYATTYASVGATSMLYSAYIVLEELDA